MKNYDLIWAREYTGITQTKLAEIFGVSRRTVINWEQGRSKLPPAKFKYLLGILDVDPNLVPRNTQPEPEPPTVAGPAPKEPEAATPSKAHKRTWKDRPLKDFRNDVLELTVELSNRQAAFDVPDAFGWWLRFWGKDDTQIFIAWQFMYSMLLSLEADNGWLMRVNPEDQDRDNWQWALTQKGWEVFEKGYDPRYEEATTAREKYPNVYNRLFGDLV